MLQDLKVKLQQSSLDEATLLDAWGQSVLWHLQATFDALVIELSDKARQNLSSVQAIMSAGDINAIDTLPAELRELAVLRVQSWLGHMLTATRDDGRDGAVSIDPLALREVSNQYFGLDELTHWYRQLDSLIDRFRETMVEY